MCDLNEQEQKVLSTIQRDETARFLQALIQQRSHDPPGDCRGAIGMVADKLAEAGIAYELFARQEHKPNLIAHFPAPCQKNRMMYHSHIDTVPAGESENWQMDPFSGEIIDGAIYGRGAGDDKGSVAAQVMAMVALARAGVPLSCCLQLVVVSDEESGGEQGTLWLHQQGRLATEALVVGEQTNNCVAVAERVACGIDLTVYGKSAHGATPWAGENAVLKAARVLIWLEEHYFPKLAAKSHSYLPPATLNIGRIRGGIQWSIVPESCKVEMDRRLLPGETREMAIKELHDALGAYADSEEPLRYELFSEGEVAANINTSPTHPFVQFASETLAQVCGERRELTGYVQTSDGRWFARDGIPIIIFGPSDPNVAHAPNEHVSIDQLLEATRFLTLFAMRNT